MGTFPNLANPIYITPTQVKKIIGTQSQSTNDDDLLLRFCEELSRRIDKYTNRFFYPRYQTIKVDWPGTSFDLKFPQDLLSLITLTNGDGNVITATNATTGNPNYFLYEQDLRPYWKMQISIISGIVFLFVGTPQQAISLHGIWGYPASEYDGSWSTVSGATVQEAVSQNATQTTLMVDTGYFQAGQTIYIGTEFEIIQSVSVLTSSNIDTLTVLRGAAGSTAAVHLHGASISTVLTHPDIFRASERLVAYAYRQKDAGIFDVVGIDTLGRLTLPSIMPRDCQSILDSYVRGHRR